MKITQKIIDDLEKALDMRKKNGDPVWDDGYEIDVCVGCTFAADKFISLLDIQNTMKIEKKINCDETCHFEIWKK